MCSQSNIPIRHGSSYKNWMAKYKLFRWLFLDDCSFFSSYWWLFPKWWWSLVIPVLLLVDISWCYLHPSSCCLSHSRCHYTRGWFFLFWPKLGYISYIATKRLFHPLHGTSPSAHAAHFTLPIHHRVLEIMGDLGCQHAIESVARMVVVLRGCLIKFNTFDLSPSVTFTYIYILKLGLMLVKLGTS